MVRKNYYLTYGVNHLDLQELRDKFYDAFDINFELRESSYLGEYYSFINGIVADDISIKVNKGVYANNLIPRDKEKYSGYDYIIDIALNTGKNKDKLSKYKYLKSIFRKWNLVLIDDDILEDMI